MVDVPATGALIVIVANRHTIAQGQTPPLVGHRRWPSESLLHAGACLSLLICHDANLCLLICAHAWGGARGM
jgi:hypothetical protein